VAVSMSLDTLVGRLRDAHGPALAGVVLYGSTADDPRAGKGHNVLVVVRSLPVAAMHAAGATARAWEEAGNPALLMLTEAEWRSSRDVFAIEHADIAGRHRVLHADAGFSIPSAAEIAPEDLRRQLEYELLALTLRVRAESAMMGRDHRLQRDVLAAHANQVVALMRAQLRTQGGDVPSAAPAVCEAVAAQAGADPAPFIAAWRQRHGEPAVTKENAERLLDGFHDGLMRLVAFTDRRKPR